MRHPSYLIEEKGCNPPTCQDSLASGSAEHVNPPAEVSTRVDRRSYFRRWTLAFGKTQEKLGFC